MNKKVNFVCLKWGDKYPALYVNRLYHMIESNLSIPFTLYCLTENSKGLLKDIEVLPLERSDLEGWWYKLLLFKKDFFGLKGELIYLDLDIVIVNNIDFLVEEKGDFIIINNWSKNKMWNSSIMRFKIGKFTNIWESFLSNKDKVIKEYNGDQEWIYHCVPNANTWDKHKIVSYKKSLKSKAFPILQKIGLCNFILKFFPSLDTPLSKDAAIVIFHGKPDPDDVATKHYKCWKRASFIQKSWSDL